MCRYKALQVDKKEYPQQIRLDRAWAGKCSCTCKYREREIASEREALTRGMALGSGLCSGGIGQSVPEKQVMTRFDKQSTNKAQSDRDFKLGDWLFKGRG